MNKRSLIIVIVLAVIALFGALVYNGLKYARGVPTPVKLQKKMVLTAPFIDQEIDLSREIDGNFTKTLSGREIELIHQLMVLPWGKSLVSPLTVKAFHNRKNIYFIFSWRDATEDREHKIGKFSDACAVMFPMVENAPPSTIMMGFMGKANIWQWKASRGQEFWRRQVSLEKAYADYHYPFEDQEILSVSKDVPPSAVSDLNSVRVGTLTVKEKQRVQGRGFWRNGFWQVFFKRALKASDAQTDAEIIPGAKRLCAFAVWDGTTGDRGGRKSISNWVELEIR